jgi:hypothetical protein
MRSGQASSIRSPTDDDGECQPDDRESHDGHRVELVRNAA